MEPYDFLKPHPYRKEFKNKKTGQAVQACKWAPDVVEISFMGKKYSKTGKHKFGLKTRTISKDEFNRKFYLHDNAI
jgi:hypothetical protein